MKLKIKNKKKKMKLNCLKTGKNKVELNLGMKKYVN